MTKSSSYSNGDAWIHLDEAERLQHVRRMALITYASRPRGKLEKMKALLIEGVDVNSKDNKGHTALKKAVSPVTVHVGELKSHVALATLLIKWQGIDINVKDNTGNTALGLCITRIALRLR